MNHGTDPFGMKPTDDPISGDIDRPSRRRWLATGAAWLGGGAAGLMGIGDGSASQHVPRSHHPNWHDAPHLLPELPDPPREFRAAWVATVANIDWPSRPGLSAHAQQQEAQALLDGAAQTGLNAIVLQVRTSGDALYASDLEPWSEYLSGEQGRHPGYDPLAYWIEQSHARGLELHAWFNPFRARHSSARSAADPLHVSRRQPAWVHTYGDMQWMDPGHPQAAAHTLAVVADVLRRYPVDGIHIDDYFYPYPIKAPGAAATDPDVDFPDDASWAAAQASGGAQGLTRVQWRRRNVDELVRGMHATVRRLRPQARFSVSPFGIGKPALRPPGIAGFSQYDQLHADVEHWLAQGWLDVLAPQLYWPRAQTAQAFAVLLDYWRAQNPMGRHIWPGLFTSRILAADAKEGEPRGARASWMPEEIEGQIRHVREVAPGTGHLHFSMVALMQDRRGIASQLRAGLYAQPALVPATPWLAPSALPAPELGFEHRGGGLQLRLHAPAGAHRVVVWTRRGGRWQWRAGALGVGQPPTVSLDGLDAVAASVLDAAGNEGARRVLQLRP